MTNHLQHLINFASNVPIYQHYPKKIYIYETSDFDIINNTIESNTPQETIDKLNKCVNKEFAELFFMCTKSMCGLKYASDNDDEDDILIIFNTETMLNAITNDSANNNSINVTIYIFDNNQFVKVLSSLGTFISVLSVYFRVTKDGTEIISCTLKSDSGYIRYKIMVQIELTNYIAFQKYVSMLTNINIICVNEGVRINKNTGYTKYNITPSIDAIRQAVTGIAQIKSVEYLDVKDTKDLLILDVILNCFKHSNIQCLITRISNEETYKLIDTLKLESLVLLLIDEDNNKHKLMANSIVNNITLHTLVVNIRENTESNMLYKSINDSTVLDVVLTFWTITDQPFTDFCKMAPFKRNFEVITLHKLSLNNMNYLSYLLNNSYYVDKLNIHFNDTFASHDEGLHNFGNIIDHLDDCITVGNINFYDNNGELINNSVFSERVTTVITDKLQNNATRRSAIRCTLLLHKIKDNLVATLPKCLLMYLVRNFF